MKCFASITETDQKQKEKKKNETIDNNHNQQTESTWCINLNN